MDMLSNYIQAQVAPWGLHPTGNHAHRGYTKVMNLILLIVVLVLLFGGGGYYYGGARFGGGGIVSILVLLLVLRLLGVI